MGLIVIAVDVGLHKADYCKSIGADYAIDISTTTDIADTVGKLSNG